jgi:hypothetical protein
MGLQIFPNAGQISDVHQSSPKYTPRGIGKNPIPIGGRVYTIFGVHFNVWHTVDMTLKAKIT